MRIPTKVLSFTICLTIFGAACSQQNEAVTVAGGSDGPHAGSISADDQVSTLDNSVTAQGLPGFCSQAALEARDKPDFEGHEDTLADKTPFHWAATWAEIDEVPLNMGVFEPLEIFNELALSKPIKRFHQRRPEHSVDVVAPGVATAEQLQQLVPGAFADAPLFVSPPTAVRLEAIDLAEGQTVLLGMLWNDDLQAFGVTSVWLVEANGQVIAELEDCGVEVVEQLRAFHASLTADGLTKGTQKDVLLGAPLELVDNFIYGDPVADKPFDIKTASSLNGGGLLVEFSFVETEGEEGLVCLKQLEDAHCVRIQAAGGMDFSTSIDLKPEVDVELVRVAEAELAGDTKGILVTASDLSASRVGISVAEGTIRIS